MCWLVPGDSLDRGFHFRLERLRGFAGEGENLNAETRCIVFAAVSLVGVYGNFGENLTAGNKAAQELGRVLQHGSSHTLEQAHGSASFSRE
jgi:hypothetical protein